MPSTRHVAVPTCSAIQRAVEVTDTGLEEVPTCSATGITETTWETALVVEPTCSALQRAVNNQI